MEPFYFLSGEDQLFGAYAAPADISSRKSVVICPPLYPEYYRSFRCLVDLAERWAATGYHVLIFDYFGTGDSSGEPAGGGPSRWVNDIEAAIRELIDVSGSDSVSLVGVRLGATLGLYAGIKNRSVKSVILWDPIWSGTEYVSSLREMNARSLNSFVKMTIDEKSKAMNEFVGYRMPGWVSEELERLSLSRAIVENLDKVTLILSEEHQLCDELAVQCRSENVELKIESCEPEFRWDDLGEDALQIPRTIERIASCLK
jgi:pimeloyl-ACP methyl ester carboxylesterase